jgi:hypothetical protein
MKLPVLSCCCTHPGAASSTLGTAVLFQTCCRDTTCYTSIMTATLDEIHRDPAILDRAIQAQAELEIIKSGRVAARFLPQPTLTIEEARELMRVRFASPDWTFEVGEPMSREERNARS